LAAALAFVQLGSSAIYGDRVPRSLGIAIYGAIERVAPAAFVEETLAYMSLNDGDFDAASRRAVALPPTAQKNELLGRIAEARGQTDLALEYYLVAPDADRVDDYVRRLAKTDQPAAYALEEELLQRLQSLTTHPDAVAEAYWKLGRIATQDGYLHPERRTEAWPRALADYRRAAALAPLSEKYLLATGNEQLLLARWDDARASFEGVLAINPSSANARAGIAAAAARRGAPQ